MLFLLVVFGSDSGSLKGWHGLTQTTLILGHFVLTRTHCDFSVLFSLIKVLGVFNYELDEYHPQIGLDETETGFIYFNLFINYVTLIGMDKYKVLLREFHGKSML